MARVRFEDVDLLGALSRIVDLHTQHYKEDFDLDKELISKLAVSERSEDKQLLWMSRPCGTYTLREREVYLDGSHENKVWRFYQEQTNDPVLAYAISLKEVRDGKIFGNLYPLNYREHVERMKKLTCPIGNVAVAFAEGNGQTAYIKPQNYEISKTRKYKKDISRRENMEYHADRDSYICRNGRELTVTNERRSKTASGYVSVKTYYRSPDCTGCPYKTECIKGNNCKTPMEKRNKVLMVSKTMSQKRAEDLERITSEYGTMLRMNRSIQAEGSFVDVKEDMNFRRYLYRGKANALAESILLAMGRNINKLHCKIQTGRTGSHLFSLKTA